MADGVKVTKCHDSWLISQEEWLGMEYKVLSRVDDQSPAIMDHTPLQELIET